MNSYSSVVNALTPLEGTFLNCTVLYVIELYGTIRFRTAVCLLSHVYSSYCLMSSPALTSPLRAHTESALAHVLCSADTVYGDVAGQMFVVQAIVDPAQFHFFQHLASQGSVLL